MFTSITLLVVFALVFIATRNSGSWGTVISYCSTLGMMLSGLGIILPLIGFMG